MKEHGYNPAEIEPKWQAFWDERKTFKAEINPQKPKYYVLDMFPYPSASGLHVGHIEGYTATDIIARYKRMKGFNVLHPMGWDAFGLPAEQHAVETGQHPAGITYYNISTYRRQIKMMGLSYDWDREFATCDADYYKFTQYIFTVLFNRGLAYQAEVAVNWCPALGTVLANEEVIDGKSERGGHPVYKKPMRQWMLKITAYAERLLQDLDLLDWPEELKTMQRNWIGKSEGATVRFELDEHKGEFIEVYTTRPDTLFGATYMVLSPEHPLVKKITTPQQSLEVMDYVIAASRKSDLERTDLAKDKTGVFTGAYAVNPVNDKKIPVWVADYVLISYGTGAIMAVPGHDERDWAFAKKFGLPIVEVVSGGNVELEAYAGEGKLVNSGILDGLDVEAAKKKITMWLKERGRGEYAVNYKLRDWLFSRQRYWGEPFPVIFTEDGQTKVLPLDELPLTLPEVESYKPAGTGESPLATIEEWLNTVDPETGKPAKRETNTMPQWAGSCWYYLRFCDPKNDKEVLSKDAEKYWMPVDLYIGGAEHAVLHLLYARFWHKVLYDAGIVSTKEPFQRLINQGMILGPDGEKMSKSRGNVINPDEVVAKYGADSVRLYEMFMGPLVRTKPWNIDGLEGIYRFLNRLWRFYINPETGEARASAESEAEVEEETKRLYHKTIKKIGEDTEGLRFNTAISQMMIFVNEAANKKLTAEMKRGFILAVAPYAPHIAEEIWFKMGGKDTLAYEPYPSYDAELAKDDELTVAVQVNGKLRATITCPRDTSEEELRELAMNDEGVKRHVEGKRIVKVISVPNRLLNIVVKG